MMKTLTESPKRGEGGKKETGRRNIREKETTKMIKEEMKTVEKMHRDPKPPLVWLVVPPRVGY